MMFKISTLTHGCLSSTHGSHGSHIEHDTSVHIRNDAFDICFGNGVMGAPDRGARPHVNLNVSLAIIVIYICI